MHETILKTKDICHRLRISRTTFWRLRQSGKFPKPGRVGGTNLQGWRESDFECWLDEHFPSSRSN